MDLGTLRQKEVQRNPNQFCQDASFLLGLKDLAAWDVLPGSTVPKPGKINSYVLRDQELKIEDNEQAQRKIINWKRRQQQKLKRNTKVLSVSELLRKKFLKKSKNKKRTNNTQRQVTNKIMKKPIVTASDWLTRLAAHFRKGTSWV